MEKTTLSKIEESINQLSLDEQLWLMERLAQSIRNFMFRKTYIESQLAAMANDPEIQRELREIEEEFRVTETDGLDAT